MLDLSSHPGFHRGPRAGSRWRASAEPRLATGVRGGPRVSVGPVVLRPRVSQTVRATGAGPGRGLPTRLGVCLRLQLPQSELHRVPPGAGQSPPALSSRAGQAVGGAAALHRAGGFPVSRRFQHWRVRVPVPRRHRRVKAWRAQPTANCPTCAPGGLSASARGPPPTEGPVRCCRVTRPLGPLFPQGLRGGWGVLAADTHTRRLLWSSFHPKLSLRVGGLDGHGAGVSLTVARRHQAVRREPPVAGSNPLTPPRWASHQTGLWARGFFGHLRPWEQHPQLARRFL